MEIFELAATLGQTLKKDDRLIALELAKADYENSEEIKSLLTEYEVQQQALQTEVGKPDRDMHLVDTLQARIDELYKLITGHKIFIRLNQAQAEVNELMNAVNNTIMMQITGEEPSGCTHNCSTCGGCH